ncbi:MAG: hypothetical protein MK105_18335 [Crocinitomicaceae bacterium]|nr:hypothetical protein [Crocinitomicaceae bacterium]
MKIKELVLGTIVGLTALFGNPVVSQTNNDYETFDRPILWGNRVAWCANMSVLNGQCPEDAGKFSATMFCREKGYRYHLSRKAIHSSQSRDWNLTMYHDIYINGRHYKGWYDKNTRIMLGKTVCANSLR